MSVSGVPAPEASGSAVGWAGTRERGAFHLMRLTLLGLRLLGRPVMGDSIEELLGHVSDRHGVCLLLLRVKSHQGAKIMPHRFC